MYVTWSGQFEYLERAVDKLKIVVPLTLLIIFVLLYFSLKRGAETMIVMPLGAVLAGRRRVVPVGARLQHEHRRGGGFHRAGPAWPPRPAW